MNYGSPCRPALAALFALGLAVATGCRTVDQVSVDTLDREIAAMGSAAKVGLTPQNLLDLDAAVASGDKAAARKAVKRGIRTPAELAHVDSDTTAMRARAKANAK